jgi:hypothetical protein
VIKRREIVTSFLESYQELISAFEVNSNPEAKTKILVKQALTDEFDVVDFIVNRTNISDIPPYTRYFYFLGEIEEMYDVKIFARNPNYSFSYAINCEHGMVLVLDDEYEQVFIAAMDDLHFLSVLTILVNYELEIIKKGRQAEGSLETQRMKCIAAAGGIDFADYYQLIL